VALFQRHTTTRATAPQCSYCCTQGQNMTSQPDVAAVCERLVALQKEHAQLVLLAEALASRLEHAAARLAVAANVARKRTTVAASAAAPAASAARAGRAVVSAPRPDVHPTIPANGVLRVRRMRAGDVERVRELFNAALTGTRSATSTTKAAPSSRSPAAKPSPAPKAQASAACHPAVLQYVKRQLKGPLASWESVQAVHSGEAGAAWVAVVMTANNSNDDVSDGDYVGVVVGAVAARAVSPEKVELQHLCVDPAYRRKGVGSRLCDEVLLYAKGRGSSVVHLDTLPQMAAAVELYASLGFTQIAANTLGSGPKQFTLLTFERRLASSTAVSSGEVAAPARHTRCVGTENTSTIAHTDNGAPLTPAPQLSFLPRFLSESQIQAFLSDGVVVVPGVLDDSEVAETCRDMDDYLRTHHGVDAAALEATAQGLAALSSTHGAGGVLDVFYPDWKLRATLLNSKYSNAMADILQATYGSLPGGEDQGWLCLAL
jgi:ribosomal protein S18 acetylase RimI-like enzyme